MECFKSEIVCNLFEDNNWYCQRLIHILNIPNYRDFKFYFDMDLK
jgi:hypothetical protein